MIKYINKLREKAGRHKVLIQNFSYLSALQVFNMLLPLITYPYLIRVLGKETYGFVVFAQAIVGYLLILVGFGFNISATKEVSIHRDNKEKLSEIVSSVLIIKSAFLILSFIILAVLLWFVPQAKGYKPFFYSSIVVAFPRPFFRNGIFRGLNGGNILLNYIGKPINFPRVICFYSFAGRYLRACPFISGIGAVCRAGFLIHCSGCHKIKLSQANCFSFKILFARFRSDCCFTMFLSNLF